MPLFPDILQRIWIIVSYRVPQQGHDSRKDQERQQGLPKRHVGTG